jgi:uncharacterized membrane protein
MIPLVVFITLTAALIPLFIYAFIDHRNTLYGNIVAAFLCAVIAGYLAVVIAIGIVQYDPVVTVNQSWVENSTCTQYNQTPPEECLSWSNTTVFTATCASCAGVPIVDPSLGYIYLLLSVIMMIYTMYMIYEAYVEYKSDQENQP